MLSLSMLFCLTTAALEIHKWYEFMFCSVGFDEAAAFRTECEIPNEIEFELIL